MKTTTIIILTLLLLVQNLTACSGNNNESISVFDENKNLVSTNSEENYTFIDDLGREITVQSSKNLRTAALLGSYADIWILAGGSICASADDAWEDFNLDLPEDCVNLGRIRSANLETLLSSEPDFVLASTNTPDHLEWREALEKAGIAVAYFDVSSFDDYLRMLKICTDICSTPELYKQYGEDLKSQIDEIIKATNSAHSEDSAQKVLVIRASAASIRAKNSNSTILGQMLADFGCVNLADSNAGLLENLNVESIILENPDKIFFIR